MRDESQFSRPDIPMNGAVGHEPAPRSQRRAVPHRLLMCRPQYFDVTYSINPAYLDWFARNGFHELLWPEHINEGEGDHLRVGRRMLAGTGFRTDSRSHAEAQEF